MERKLLLQLIALFLITQVLGLFVAYNFVGWIAAGEMEQPGIVSPNPNDIWNVVALVVEIIIVTAVLLLALKFIKKRISIFLKIFESFVVLTTSLLAFSLIFAFFLGDAVVAFGFTIADIGGIILALALLVSRVVFSKNIWLRNVSSILSAAVVGALIGVMFGLIPVLIFVIALAVYDYISVFKTKHMVALAKGIQGKNLAFTIAMPTKQHTFELGTGDFVVPLAFATSAMSMSFGLGYPNFLVTPLLILFGSIFGLVLTLEYLSKRVGTALPALPVQTSIMLAMFLLGKLLGF